MKRLILRGWRVAAFCCVFSGSAAAQNNMIPPACAGNTGEALRECVRDITPPQQIEQLTPIKPAPDPTQPINCPRLLPADQAFCVSRNEIILECRKNRRPDFGKCFAQYAAHVPAPAAADCARVRAELRPQCKRRNTKYMKCAADPLHYFMCIEDPGVKK